MAEQSYKPLRDATQNLAELKELTLCEESKKTVTQRLSVISMSE